MPAALAFLFRVLIMARGTCGSVKRLGMAIAAGGAAVIDASPTFVFVRDTGVGTVVAGKPVFCCMAADTIQAKHARMKCRVAVTAGTVRG